jgi:hypothetical protein
MQKIVQDLAEGNYTGQTRVKGGSQKALSQAVDVLHNNMYTLTSFGTAKTKKNTVHTTIPVVGHDLVEVARLKEWIAAQHPLAGQFIHIIHNKAMRCTAQQIRGAMLTRLGVTIGENNSYCPSCRDKGIGDGSYISFDAHAEICRHADGGCNFSAECHSEVQREIAGSNAAPLCTIPGARVKTGAISISRHFPIRNKAQLSQAKIDEYNGMESDILLRSTGDTDKLIDICVTSVHTSGNSATCGKTGASATRYERANKFKKHDKFMGDPQHLTSMGFDSRGGWSDNAVKVLRGIFARSRRTVWKSDAIRIWLQRRTVCVISAVIHKWQGHRRTILLDCQRAARRPIPAMLPAGGPPVVEEVALGGV